MDILKDKIKKILKAIDTIGKRTIEDQAKILNIPPWLLIILSALSFNILLDFVRSFHGAK